jgi:glycosyltransferase involved in cell wall biosynthesis
VIRQQNRGVGAARNAGLALADTPYVVFLDQDDRLAPGALAHALGLLDAEPKAVFASGRNRTIRADGGAWSFAVAGAARCASRARPRRRAAKPLHEGRRRALPAGEQS